MTRDTPADGGLHVVTLLAVFAWTVAQTSPWNPSLEADLFILNLDRLWFAIGAGYLDPWRLVQAGAGWLAIGLLLTLPLRHGWLALPGFTAFALSLLFFRMLMAGGAASAEALVTLPAALFTAAPLAITVRRSGRAAIVAVAATLGLLAWQLRPAVGFDPDGGPAHGMHLHLAHPAFVLQAASAFAAYALALAVAGRAMGGHPMRWACGALALVGVSELMQLALPGRVAEPLAMLAAAAATLLGTAILGRRAD